MKDISQIISNKVTPRKKRELITELAKREEIVKNVKPIRGMTRTSQSTLDKIQAFYCRSDISRQAPGWKDVKKSRDPVTKKWVSHQVSHLFYTISESFRRFKREYPDENVGRTIFWKYKPFWVKSCSTIPKNICCCEIHENFMFLLKAGHAKKPSV